MTFQEAAATEKRIRMTTWPSKRWCEKFVNTHYWNGKTMVQYETPQPGVFIVFDKMNLGKKQIEAVREPDVSQEWLTGRWELLSESPVLSTRDESGMP